MARENTERWVHQQQIRDALTMPGFREPRYFAPVLGSFVHALPRTFCDVDAPPGACLRLAVSGPAGGRWIALRTTGARVLGQDQDGPATATITIDQDTAWRLFTKGISRDAAMARVSVEGDRSLGRGCWRWCRLLRRAFGVEGCHN